jgi:DNA mismatch repair protein MutS
MKYDGTTLLDLSFFGEKGADGVFEKTDRTTTRAGSAVLRKLILEPPDTLEELLNVQESVSFWSLNLQFWTNKISNGTVVMLEQYFNSAENTHIHPMSFPFSNFFYKIIFKSEYSFLKFSLSHISDFLKGCNELVEIRQKKPPHKIETLLLQMEQLLNDPVVTDLTQLPRNADFMTLVRLHHKTTRQLKLKIRKLKDLYALLDALQGMGRATVELNWVFPEFTENNSAFPESENLYHPLLPAPVGYNLTLKGERLLLLTGANMAGKSTFLRTLGIAAVLAHAGMSVPAQRYKTGFLDGIITNMHINDDILGGESYFLAEVHRMKDTAGKMSRSSNCLILIDELFKGTNVKDAFECTVAVTEGLLAAKKHAIVLSTHLYEAAEKFQGMAELHCAYFPTVTNNEGNFIFSYQLQSGISKDRIGFSILQREQVLQLLSGIAKNENNIA